MQRSISSTVFAAGVAVLATGCGGLFAGDSGDESGDPSGGDGGGSMLEPLGRVTSWPVFELDCDVAFDGSIRVIQQSGSADTLGLSIGNWLPGAIAGDPRLDIAFRPGQTHFDVDRREAEVATDFDLLVQVGNTMFSNRQPHDGETRGQVDVVAFDAEAGIATFELVDVKLLGADAVYAGDYRCGMSGRLSVELGRGALGSPCREDYECGGDRSVRVCDFDDLVCAMGCHVDEQCPQGQLCDGESCTPE